MSNTRNLTFIKICKKKNSDKKTWKKKRNDSLDQSISSISKTEMGGNMNIGTAIVQPMKQTIPLPL